MSVTSASAVLVAVFWAGSGVSSQQIPMKNYEVCKREKDTKLTELAEDYKKRNENGWNLVVSGTCFNTQ